MSKIKIAAIVGAIILVILAVVAVSRQGTTSSTGDVATVNGVSLPRDEYDARIAQLTAQSQGVGTPEQYSEQVINQMVSEELLVQDAKSKGIEVSEEDRNAQFDTLVANFESREAFDQALVTENLTEEQLRENIHNQLILEQYVQRVIEENNIEVSEEEVVTYFEQSIEGMEDAPTLDEVREQVEMQVQQEKLAVKMQEIITTLRGQADVQILI